MAKLAENQVAVDAELDDAILRGRAVHGQDGNDGPVGRGRSFVLLPIHEEAPTARGGATFPNCLKRSTFDGQCGPRRAGRGQANMALQGPVCWPNIAKSRRLC